MSRGGLERLRDALDHCDHAMRLASGPAAEQLGSDRVRRQAVLYDLIIVGTTFADAPADITSFEPRIPWRAITRARNRFVHAYWDLDIDFIKGVVGRDLPRLRDLLQGLIATLEAQRE